ncbi:single-stranded DNA-binding protein [Haloferula sargassicola]|uniref:Single-stranded DNA-binding protein n=1 Tax=Haloferula sargassicola TaxID=490096 RepID=A0ABP9UR06_9BACT
MIDMNQLTITGNLVANPETQQAGEATVTRARLIHTESYKDRESGEWKKGEPMAIDFEIWNGYGEAFAKAATKGAAVLIEGRIRPNNYTRKEDGVTVYGYRVRVDRWQIVAKPGARPAAKGQARTRRGKGASAANG